MTIAAAGRLINRAFRGVLEFVSGYFTDDAKTQVYFVNDSKSDYLKHED